VTEPFRVALTRDFLTPDGRVGWGDIGLDMLDAAEGLEWEFLPEDHVELPAGSLSSYHALIALTPRISAGSLRGADRLRLVARFGVGYDSVDVAACTEAGVALTITPDGVRRPVAVSALTLLLALAHRLADKDRLVRENHWADRLDFMGRGVTGRTVGLVGWGNIGREVTRLLEPLQMRRLAHDPYASAEAAAAAGVELTGLDELLERSDFVVLTCALTDQTRHLLDANRLARMRPSAYLVNVSRGPVVDQRALTEALAERRIAGAALDVFELEPPDPNDPLLRLDNVLLTPHAVCWTDEMAKGNGTSAIGAVLDVAAGKHPNNMVNPDALRHPGARAHFGTAGNPTSD
jgi:phosphoglycerate dehydrogenase-like enzyme